MGTKKSGNKCSVWSQLIASPGVNKTLSPKDVLRKLSFAVEMAEAGMVECAKAGDHDGARRWAHCLAQEAHAYSKAYVVAELEPIVREWERGNLSMPAAVNGAIHIVETNDSLTARLRALQQRHLIPGKIVKKSA